MTLNYGFIVDDLPIGTDFYKVQNSPKWQLVDLDGIVHFRAELSGPPPKINFESYKKFKKLSDMQQNGERSQAETSFRSGAISSGNAYTTPKTHLGKQIPRSNNGTGVSPDFKNLEMASSTTPPPYTLGNGETNIIGLTEPLQSIIQKIRNFGGEVKVPVLGDKRKFDYINAWKKMGINPDDGEKLIKDLDLVWHHVDDIDINMNSTMQLVFEEAHYITYKHSGSVKQMDIFFDLINGL